MSSSDINIVFVKSEDLCGTVVSDETSRLLLSLERAVVAPDKTLAHKFPTLELMVVETFQRRQKSSMQVGTGTLTFAKAHRDDWTEMIGVVMPASGHLGAATLPTS